MPFPLAAPWLLQGGRRRWRPQRAPLGCCEAVSGDGVRVVLLHRRAGVIVASRELACAARGPQQIFACCCRLLLPHINRPLLPLASPTSSPHPHLPAAGSWACTACWQRYCLPTRCSGRCCHAFSDRCGMGLRHRRCWGAARRWLPFYLPCLIACTSRFPGRPCFMRLAPFLPSGCAGVLRAVCNQRRASAGGDGGRMDGLAAHPCRPRPAVARHLRHHCARRCGGQGLGWCWLQAATIAACCPFRTRGTGTRHAGRTLCPCPCNPLLEP